MKLKLIILDDWEEFYINNKLILENHRINNWEIINEIVKFINNELYFNRPIKEFIFRKILK